MTKQQAIIHDVNMLSGHVTWEYLSEKHGKKNIESALSRGFIKLDAEGMVHISERTFQLNVKLRGKK